MSSLNLIEHDSHDDGGESGQKDAHGQRGEERPAERRDSLGAELFVGGVGGEYRHGVGADSEEADVSDGQQAGVSHDQVQADGEYRPDSEHRSDGYGESEALPKHERDGPSYDEQACPELYVALGRPPEFARVSGRRYGVSQSVYAERHCPISSAAGRWARRTGTVSEGRTIWRPSTRRRGPRFRTAL